MERAGIACMVVIMDDPGTGRCYILAGTPSRVVDRIYFKDNDVFTCEIEDLGRLSNSFKLAI